MSTIHFESEWHLRVPSRPQIITLMREALGKGTVEWDDLTTLNLGLVRDRIVSAVSPNSACTYLAEIKAFLSRYRDEGIIPCKDPHRELKGKKAPSQHIALTEEEVMRIDGYAPKNNTERDVKIVFMRGCLTGARHSDCVKFNADNIQGDVFVYVSQKTKTEVVLPVHRLLPKYLEMQPEKEHKTAVFNRTLRRICRDLGINDEVTLFVTGTLRRGEKYEFVSSHTARRSFVSNLALRDVPISVISKMAGHSSTTMTDRYVAIDTRRVGGNAMAFFCQ